MFVPIIKNAAMAKEEGVYSYNLHLLGVSIRNA